MVEQTSRQVAAGWAPPFAAPRRRPAARQRVDPAIPVHTTLVAPHIAPAAARQTAAALHSTAVAADLAPSRRLAVAVGFLLLALSAALVGRACAPRRAAVALTAAPLAVELRRKLAAERRMQAAGRRMDRTPADCASALCRTYLVSSKLINRMSNQKSLIFYVIGVLIIS